MNEKYPFHREEEVLPVEYQKALPGIYGKLGVPARKFHTPITPKENFLRMCRHESPVWVPNYVFGAYEDWNGSGRGNCYLWTHVHRL